MLKQQIGGAIRLFRPELPTAAGVCVVIGEILALGTLPPLPTLVLGFLCVFLLSGSALITNDYFDLEVDKINAPQRPLPSGAVSPRTVMILGILTALIGLLAALSISPLAFVFSLIIWVMGFLYNWRLKAAGIWGNLIVSASVAATFVLGGLAVGQVWHRTVWVFGLIVFFFDLAEEIAGDAMDAEGDRQRASKSIAIMYGKPTALRLSGLLFGLVIALTLLLIAWGDASLRYWLILPLMDVTILYFVGKLLRSQTSAEGRQSMRGLYLSASLGLVAFLISLFFA
ncbi:MAG: UbiA family prenyltransferase [Anaerolineae bacterium]|nr:UbiA family prenyltransferase [Anaerolineae bacterium]